MSPTVPRRRPCPSNWPFAKPRLVPQSLYVATCPPIASTAVTMQPQPDDMTCGPTCLHAVYRYFDDDVPLEQVVGEASMLDEGGTLAVLLGCHAQRRGYEASIYTYNLDVFDPQLVQLAERQNSDPRTSGTGVRRPRRTAQRPNGGKGFAQAASREPGLHRIFESRRHDPHAGSRCRRHWPLLPAIDTDL